MTTILVSFLVALMASLLLTPLARTAGLRFGAMDLPDARKAHTVAVPRVGGVAIYIAVVSTVAILVVVDAGVSKQLALDEMFIYLFLGASLCFITGLVDDFRPLGARLKLVLQILAATLAWSGGNWIAMGYFHGLGWFGVLASYGLTVFWFLLFVNAVNLIDGLDGLSGGVCFFAALVMILVTVMAENYAIAMLFAALGGGILGFLRYNFNPASIFLGDGGSYFLGFAIAGLSIMGNVKEQTGAAVLIPLIAMGVPLFDTLLTTVRRFLRGRAIFGADNRHLHHRLIGMGLTMRRAVLLVYAMTIALCVAALVVAHLRDGRAGFVLIALGVGAIVLTRHLGYFDVLGFAQFRNWIGDVSHASGLSHQRREFLNLQLEIHKATSPDELWLRVVDALRFLNIDHARLYLASRRKDRELNSSTREDCARTAQEGEQGRAGSGELPYVPDYAWDALEDGALAEMTGHYSCGGYRAWHYRVELPLIADSCNHVAGVLVLSKNHDLGRIGPATLLSIEYLRRTLADTLERVVPSELVDEEPAASACTDLGIQRRGLDA